MATGLQLNTYEAVWQDSPTETFPKQTFNVDIALMYKHDNLDIWNELSQEDRDYFDDEVFYYVDSEEVLADLFDPNNEQDFYLVKEIG